MSERDLRLAILVGSLREASVNRQLALLAVEYAPAGVDAHIVEGLGDLPFYNQDDDGEEADPRVAAVRAVVGAADAVLIVTPEYNGTIPGVLKNAIDWLSRPYGAGALHGKPVGVIGAALGRYAGTWSREDTRKSVGIAGGVVVEAVEVGVGAADLGAEGVRSAELIGQVSEAVAVLRDAVLAGVRA